MPGNSYSEILRNAMLKENPALRPKAKVGHKPPMDYMIMAKCACGWESRRDFWERKVKCKNCGASARLYKKPREYIWVK